MRSSFGCGVAALAMGLCAGCSDHATSRGGTGGTAGSVGTGGIYGGGAPSSGGSNFGGSSAAPSAGGAAGAIQGDASAGTSGSAGSSDAGAAGAPDANVPWTTVDAPGEITTPGHYRLDTDLTNATTALHVHDTSDVEIDCQGHSILSTSTTDGAVHIHDVQRFSVSRCVIGARSDTVTTYGLTLENAQDGTFTNDDLTAVNIKQSKTLTFQSNQVHRYFQAYETVGTLVEGNTFDGDATVTTAASIVFATGSDNVVRNNHIDGHWDGTLGNQLGADDGIVVQDEARDTVVGNTFVNNWDCGIETVGVISDSTFDDNVVTKAGNCCVGAWYGNNWRNNGVTGNQCTDVGALFVFRRYFALAPTETTLYFQDNRFESNTQFSGGLEFTSVFDLINLPPEIPTVSLALGNNRFTSNVFAGPTPILMPSSMIVDGGGNTCQQGSDSTFPLACGRP